MVRGVIAGLVVLFKPIVVELLIHHSLDEVTYHLVQVLVAILQN